MIVYTSTPSSLLFGLARLASGQLAWLGLTLQHPPISLGAWPAAALSVTGARADLAHAAAARVMERLGLPAAEIEIEYAIPRHMGLASDPMMALSAAYSLAAANHDLRAEDTLALADALGLARSEALAVQGFHRGGFLLVPVAAGEAAWPAPLRRFELAHDDEHSWAWVLHWPLPPDDTPPTLEADRLSQLLAAAEHLSPETGRLVEDELWPALERDDMPAFGQALMAFQALNQDALAQAGTPPASAPTTAGVLDVLRSNGALAWGESARGLAPFGLLRGGKPSITLRKQVVDYLGYEGGTVMAAIADNTGAVHKVETARRAEP